jgi:hypothetical protein
MKTQEHVIRWRENHHKALETLRAPGVTTNGLDLWRKLCRVESAAHLVATHYCNGAVDGDHWEMIKEDTRAKVARIFGKLPDGFFVNGDPRGYALKLDNEKVTIPEGMHKDWGGYGILAPIIDNE